MDYDNTVTEPENPSKGLKPFRSGAGFMSGSGYRTGNFRFARALGRRNSSETIVRARAHKHFNRQSKCITSLGSNFSRSI